MCLWWHCLGRWAKCINDFIKKPVKPFPSHQTIFTLSQHVILAFKQWICRCNPYLPLLTVLMSCQAKQGHWVVQLPELWRKRTHYLSKRRCTLLWCCQSKVLKKTCLYARSSWFKNICLILNKKKERKVWTYMAKKQEWQKKSETSPHPGLKSLCRDTNCNSDLGTTWHRILHCCCSVVSAPQSNIRDGLRSKFTVLKLLRHLHGSTLMLKTVSISHL